MAFSRRAALAAGAAGLTLGSGCLDSLPSGVSDDHALTGEYEITEFVERNGADLELGGAEYRYNGMMALDLTRRDQGKSWINTAIDTAVAYDIDVYRCWGFESKDWDYASHQAPGEFDDAWIELFDYTVAKAKEAGIRLVVPLLQGVLVDQTKFDDVPAAPSPAAYKLWSDTVSDTDRWMEAFVNDDQATEYYKEYIRHFLTRENQYTGIEYRNEPTILLFECANEIEYKHPDRVGQSLDFWYKDIASHIRSHTSNHLVSTGMHGSMGEIYAPWTERCAYVRDHQVDEIDVCSFHDYPVYFAGDRDGSDVRMKSLELASRYAEHKIGLAHETVGKPVYAGEYGVAFKPYAEQKELTELEDDVPEDDESTSYWPDQHDDSVLVHRILTEDVEGTDLETRERYFQNITDTAETHQLDGMHFWTLSYDFRPEDGSEEKRRQHREQYDPLITYASDDQILSTIATHHERVATR